MNATEAVIVAYVFGRQSLQVKRGPRPVRLGTYRFKDLLAVASQILGQDVQLSLSAWCRICRRLNSVKCDAYIVGNRITVSYEPESRRTSNDYSGFRESGFRDPNIFLLSVAAGSLRITTKRLIRLIEAGQFQAEVREGKTPGGRRYRVYRSALEEFLSRG